MITEDQYRARMQQLADKMEKDKKYAVQNTLMGKEDILIWIAHGYGNPRRPWPVVRTRMQMANKIYRIYMRHI